MTGNTPGTTQVAGDLDKSGCGVTRKNKARADMVEEEVEEKSYQ